MARDLPEGLVVSNDAVAGEIQRVDSVAVEDLIKLWRGEILDIYAQHRLLIYMKQRSRSIRPSFLTTSAGGSKTSFGEYGATML